MKKYIISKNILFYFALILYEFSSMFSNVYFFNKHVELVINISIFLLLINFIINSKTYSLKSIIILLLLLVFFAINSFIIGDKRMLILLLFCISYKNINFKKLLAFNWKFQLFLFMIVILLYNLGLTDNYIMYRENGTIRSSMGFSHPNVFGVYIFSIFCQLIYCKYNDIRLTYLLPLVLLLTFTISYFSDSRGSSYSIILLYLFLIYIKKKKTININKNNKILYLMPIIFSLLSIVIAANYDRNNTLMVKTNIKLSGRISAAHLIMEKYDYKIFGQKLDLVSTKEAIKEGKQALVLDNSYIKLIYQYGLIVYGIFMLFYCISIKKTIKNKNYILTCILLLYLIRGLTENIMFNFYGNIFLLIFSTILYGDDFYVNENKK